jgi:hypothetical protein
MDEKQLVISNLGYLTSTVIIFISKIETKSLYYEK